MTEPLTPETLDLRDFQFMPLDVVRLVDSDLSAVSTGDEFKAAVILWCKSWHQIPAASLPDDDRMLAHLAGFGRDLKSWLKVKDMALRGFEKCSDGRLYHRHVAEKAREAGEAKQRQRERTNNATIARLQRSAQRDDARNVERDEQRNENRNVHQGTGTGTGTGKIDDEVARAREPLADLEVKLREAAGWQNEPAPKLAVTGPIAALIEAGADLETDVLPTVRAIAPQAESRTSWNYFVKAIAKARDRRIEAASVVSPPETRGNHNGSKPRKSTIEQIFDAVGPGPGEGAPDVSGDPFSVV